MIGSAWGTSPGTTDDAVPPAAGCRVGDPHRRRGGLLPRGRRDACQPRGPGGGRAADAGGRSRPRGAGVAAGRPPAEPAAAPPPVELSPGPVSLSADGLRTVAGPAAPEPPPPLPGREAVRIDIEASETEPNDTIAGANLAGLGTAIDGDADRGRSRLLRARRAGRHPRRPGREPRRLTRRRRAHALRRRRAGRSAAPDTNAQLGVRTTTLERLIDGPRYYVAGARASGAAGAYQLTVAPRRR